MKSDNYQNQLANPYKHWVKHIKELPKSIVGTSQRISPAKHEIFFKSNANNLNIKNKLFSPSKKNNLPSY